jgi:very-short-patch-repair endonuclease
VTYAKGPDGRLRYNFGPINGQNGWRRLNVLTTRARRRMRVFSSMRADDINAAATGSSGPRLLQDFLRYAETGRLESVVASATAAAESPFERQVASELARRGIKVVPQVGVAGYRIDIGVLDDEVPGRYVCGIECDGVAYHSAETARDRDRLRQQVLEGRGWTIVRVWSTDWFKDRPGQIERLLRLIAQAKADVQAGIERDHRERRDTATENHRTAARQNASADYVRPIAEAYRFAGGAGQYAGSEFLEAPSVRVTSAIVDVVNAESPVHIDDLTTRVAGMWSVGRVGSRIGARVVQELARAVKAGDVVLRGEFAWTPAMARGEVEVPVRSRAGTRISGERVAVEEIRAAIQRVLEGCRGLTHDELLSETRQMLGVGKGSVAPTFETTLQQMVQQGQIGEGSAGYAIRV